MTQTLIDYGLNYLICAAFIFAYTHLVLAPPGTANDLYKGQRWSVIVARAAFIFLVWPLVIVIGVGSIFTRPRLRALAHLVIMTAVVLYLMSRPALAHPPKDESRWTPVCAELCLFT